MADVEEDRISIVIEAETGNARNEIANLDHALDELAGKVGGTVNSAFARLSEMGKSGFSGISSALKELSDSNASLKGFADNMGGVAKGLGSLAGVSGDDIDATARNVRQLAGGIGSLEGVDANRLDALASAMGSLPNAMSKVAKSSTDLDDVRDRMDGLADAVGRAAEKGNAIGNLGSGLRNIPKGLSEFAELGNMSKGLLSFRAALMGISESLGTFDAESRRGASAVKALGDGLKTLSALGSDPEALSSSLTNAASALDTFVTSAKRTAEGTEGFNAMAASMRTYVRTLGELPASLSKMGTIDQYAEPLRTFRAVVERLLQTLGLFDKEARQQASAFKSLGEGVKTLSSLGSDVETLRANLSAVVPVLSGFVTELNGAVSDDDLARFRELALAVDEVAQAYSRLQPAQQAVSAATTRGASAGGGSGQPAWLRAMQAAVPAVQWLGNKAGGVLSKGWDLATAAAQRYVAAMQRIVSVPIDSIRSRIDGVAHSLSRIASMAASAVFYNALFSGLRAAVDGLTTGIQNLYQWAIVMGDGFVGTMDSCATSLQYFQNSIGGAASELLDALAPAFETIINYAVAALNAVNQLLAALTGHGTWRRARRAQTSFAQAATGAAAASDDAASAADDDASATDDATKAAKAYENTVLGFDELNKLNDTSDTSGSGSKGKSPKGSKSKSPSGGSGVATPDYGSMFEEVPIDDYFKDLANTDDWTKLGEDIAQALNDWEKAIDWDRIDKVAATWSKRVWTAFNGFVRKRDWSSFGYTIARGLNVGLHFIDDIAQNARFDEFGAGIAGALNRAVETIDWAALGRVMTDKLKVQLEFLHGFMRGANGNDTYAKFNFDALRDRLNVAIDAAFDNIDWQTALTDLTDFFGECAKTIASGFSEIARDIDAQVQATDWTGWGSQVADRLGEALGLIDWGALGRLLTDGLKVVFEGLHGFLDESEASGFWTSLGNDIETAITSAFNNIDWAQAGMDFNRLANHLLDVIEQAIGAINWDDINSFISNLDPGQLFARGLELFAGLLAKAIESSFENGTWPLVVAYLVGKAAPLAIKVAALFVKLKTDKGILDAAGKLGEAAGGKIPEAAGEAVTGSGLGSTIASWLVEHVGASGTTTAAASAGSAIGLALGGAIGLGIGFDGINRQLDEGISALGAGETIGGAALAGASVGGAFGGPMGAAIGAAIGAAGGALTELGVTVYTKRDEISEKLGTAFDSFKDAASSLPGKVGDALSGLMEKVKEEFGPTVAYAEEAGEDTGTNYASGAGSKRGDVTSTAQSLGEGVRDKLSSFASAASAWGDSLGSNLRSGMSGTFSSVRSTAQSLGNGVKEKISPFVTQAQTWGKDVSNRFGGGIRAAIHIASSAAKSVASEAKSPLSSLSSVARSWGSDLASRFANGIRAGIGWVGNAARSIAARARSYLHFSEPDVGPLSDFHTYGPDMMRELASGIERYSYLVTDSVRDVTGGMATSFQYDPRDLRDSAQATIANAVTLGVVGSQPVAQQQAQQSQRPIELVLRVDGETLARATYPGLSSLVDRGVITPEFV